MPILSVIIPTHNRQRYAIDAITSILKNCPDTEVVVTDTSDTREIEEKLSHWIQSGRLVYDHPSQAWDVVRNFENGLALATGNYLVFLGDDDCLGPDIERIANWATLSGIDAISSSLAASYFWPDFKSLYFGGEYTAKLTVQPYTAKATTLSGVDALREALENMGMGVMHMPRAYLGMISNELAKRIKAKYGSLFGGVSPDIYSAALISVESVHSISLDYPFIIAGSSGASTSGQSAEGKHKGGLRSNPHISAFTDLKWDPLIPEFYSVHTVWGFSLKKASDILNKNEYSPNLLRLYAKCCLHHPAYWREIIRSLLAYLIQRKSVNIFFVFPYELGRELLRRMKRYMQIRKNPAIRVDCYSVGGVQSVSEAYKYLEKHVKVAPQQLDFTLINNLRV